jgi:hypothetical protein
MIKIRISDLRKVQPLNAVVSDDLVHSKNIISITLLIDESLFSIAFIIILFIIQNILLNKNYVEQRPIFL